MKLAEALILRADLQKRLEQLRQRLAENALMQEGEQPAENPEQLLQEVWEAGRELENLVGRINLTNASVKRGEKTLTELLARREALSLQVSIMRTALEAASRKVMRGGRNEVKILSALDVPALRKNLDEKSRVLRILDTSIQESNWLTELL